MTCDWKEDKEVIPFTPPNAIVSNGYGEGLHMKCYTCGKQTYLKFKEDGRKLTCNKLLRGQALVG